MLSFRYLSDDHFWFTFFHEAGHLLLHSQQSIFLESDDMAITLMEQEANNFAAETLVPGDLRAEMLRLRMNPRDIIRFAVQTGISPGIVVGQLQHHKKIAYSRFNRLKRRYKWL
jgi:Zn-dependent peptidase ImmA (M78 family)